MKNLHPFYLITLLLVSYSVAAQDFKVSINKLTAETQQLSESPDNLKLVWWIPIEFWEAVFDQDKNMPKELADEILQVFKQYTLLSTIDGTIGTFGDIAYKTKKQIFNSLEIIDNNNKSYFPLREERIDQHTKDVIAYIKPVLANMLGKMGENMYFFLFQKEDNPNDRIINPTKEENFTVKLGGEELRWNLPLSSLLKPKKCPVDNKLMSGAWKYCPYHGVKLEPSN